jgi:hypothetical protein
VKRKGNKPTEASAMASRIAEVPSFEFKVLADRNIELMISGRPLHDYLMSHLSHQSSSITTEVAADT